MGRGGATTTPSKTFRGRDWGKKRKDYKAPTLGKRQKKEVDLFGKSKQKLAVPIIWKKGKKGVLF